MEWYKKNVLLDSEEEVIIQDAMVTEFAHPIPHSTPDSTSPISISIRRSHVKWIIERIVLKTKF